MAITVTPAPQEALAVLLDTLDDIAGNTPTRSIADDSDSLVAPLPFGLFRLSLDQLNSPSAFEDAARIGWRYLLTGTEGPAFADILSDRDGQTLQFGQLATGRLAVALVDCAFAAERLGNDAEYEARILDIPACHMTALWLEGPTRCFLLASPEQSERFDEDEMRAYLVEAATRIEQADL